jgi:vanillate O-demethylase ferredoxin subunit
MAVEGWDARLFNGPLGGEPVDWFEVEVVEAWPESATVRCLCLRRAAGAPLPTFEPGAHIDLKVANALTQSYSPCSLDGERGCLIAVQRSPTSRGGSSHLHAETKVGDRLMITPPRNHVPLPVLRLL